MPFKSEKFCEVCNAKLKLNNTRDIERKKFCSHSCRCKHTASKRSPEVMRKMQNAAHTPEVKAKRSASTAGKNNPRWIKDRSKVKHPRGKKELIDWRKKVYEEGGYTCMNCNKTGGQLNAHHVAPYKEFPQFRETLSNGKTLCVPCHKEIHKVARELFSAI